MAATDSKNNAQGASCPLGYMLIVGGLLGVVIAQLVFKSDVFLSMRIHREAFSMTKVYLASAGLGAVFFWFFCAVLPGFKYVGRLIAENSWLFITVLIVLSGTYIYTSCAFFKTDCEYGVACNFTPEPCTDPFSRCIAPYIDYKR